MKQFGFVKWDIVQSHKGNICQNPGDKILNLGLHATWGKKKAWESFEGVYVLPMDWRRDKLDLADAYKKFSLKCI